MIFAIIKTYRDARRGVKDPTGFGRDLALDAIKAPLMLFTIVSILGLILFFILGYTDLIINSVWFFRFLFVVGLLIFLPIFFISWTLFSKIKALTEKAKKKVDERVFEAEVVDREL